MKKIIGILFVVIVLVVGAFYLKKDSSYTEIEKSVVNQEDEKNKESKPERTPEDIAADKKVEALKKRNRELRKEGGGTGISLPQYIKDSLPEIDSKDSEELNDVVEKFLEEHADKYENDMYSIDLAEDLRLYELVYGENKPEFLNDYIVENVTTRSLERLDRKSAYLVIGRKTEDSPWEIITAGTYYELRDGVDYGD